MKKIVFAAMIFSGSLSARPANGQNFDEWFRQKRTRIRYLEQQLAALGDLLHTLDKGYQLVESGLDRIGNAKGSEYSIHSNYYSSLSTVLATIGSGADVQSILEIQANLANQIGAAIRYWQDQRNSIQP
jgi:hypothetical protein